MTDLEEAIEWARLRASLTDNCNESDNLLALVAAARRELARQVQVGTHWEGCWRHHLMCAELRVSELERELKAERKAGAELRAIVDSLPCSTDDSYNEVSDERI